MLAQQIYERCLRGFDKLVGDGNDLTYEAFTITLWLALNEQEERHMLEHNELASALAAAQCELNAHNDALTAAWNEAGMLRQQRGTLTEELQLTQHACAQLRTDLAEQDQELASVLEQLKASQNAGEVIQLQLDQVMKHLRHNQETLRTQDAELTSLRTALAATREQPPAPRTTLTDDAATSMLAFIRAGADAPPAAPPPSSKAPAKKRAKPAPDENATGNEIRTRALALVRTLNTTLGCAPTMQQFDSARIKHSTTAAVIAKRFGANNWQTIINDALTM